MNIDPNIVITANLGVLIWIITTYGKLVAQWTKAELKQEHQKAQLDAAHEKIRELEKRINGKN